MRNSPIIKWRNAYPKSIRIYTIYGIGTKISSCTYRQPDNTSIAIKPEGTYTYYDKSELKA